MFDHHDPQQPSQNCPPGESVLEQLLTRRLAEAHADALQLATGDRHHVYAHRVPAMNVAALREALHGLPGHLAVTAAVATHPGSDQTLRQVLAYTDVVQTSAADGTPDLEGGPALRFAFPGELPHPDSNSNSNRGSDGGSDSGSRSEGGAMSVAALRHVLEGTAGELPVSVHVSPARGSQELLRQVPLRLDLAVVDLPDGSCALEQAVVLRCDFPTGTYLLITEDCAQDSTEGGIEGGAAPIGDRSDRGAQR
ncbi:hypothetical protein CLV92_12022 [Kineococcus xinjiangensis]|uniref:Uncharacterized protein n=1 Tax=Kineococcus xinjiangensis TaxID=512762 RepID=A0A2S6ICK8_9ACTN|nr:DUF6225 family protein [Kineococcus xinjiangensis]PPK91903.1 hypothetical protein CLV92_12022 [Kineococcus xinjiangensis]